MVLFDAATGAALQLSQRIMLHAKNLWRPQRRRLQDQRNARPQAFVLSSYCVLRLHTGAERHALYFGLQKTDSKINPLFLQVNDIPFLNGAVTNMPAARPAAGATPTGKIKPQRSKKGASPLPRSSLPKTATPDLPPAADRVASSSNTSAAAAPSNNAVKAEQTSPAETAFQKALQHPAVEAAPPQAQQPQTTEAKPDNHWQLCPITQVIGWSASWYHSLRCRRDSLNVRSAPTLLTAGGHG